MADYTITKVRKEWSSDGSHRHITGVLTNGGSHYTRQDVVNSIGIGHSWEVNAGGHHVRIRVIASCLHESCSVAPYIKTNSGSTGLDNLENLPEE